MKTYTVTARFVFEGRFFIRAETKAEAERLADGQCGLVLGGNIHTTLPDEDADWDFPIHPETEIVNIRRGEKDEMQTA